MSVWTFTALDSQGYSGKRCRAREIRKSLAYRAKVKLAARKKRVALKVHLQDEQGLLL
ncbi:MAG: hypothetical protein ACP5LS_05355 [Thermoprotei archaeon]